MSPDIPPVIPSDNRAISSLNLMNAGLTYGALKAYPGQYGAGNEGYREEAEWGTKNSDFETDMSGIIVLANAIPDMGALLVLSLKDNRLATAEAGQALGKALQGNTVLKELDVSSNSWDDTWSTSKVDGPGFASGISKGLSDNGAISSVNLLGNKIPAEQAQELVKVMQAKEKLTTLCGLSRDETELDSSGQNLGAGDAVLIANDISDIRALTSLDLSLNCLQVEGAKIVAEAIKVTDNAIAVVLAQFSCPSDHWLNSCCLLLSTG
jgi:hypothetical protein